MTLEDLGWSTSLATALKAHEQGGWPARVLREDRERYLVATGTLEGPAVISGRLRGEAQSRIDFPAVGDWVALRPGGDQSLFVIEQILPRKSVFLRRAPGAKVEEQVIAANIDTVLHVTGLDQDFSIRRIERYVTLAWESGAVPVVVLNKSDLRTDVEACIEKVKLVCPGVAVIAVSALDGAGLESLHSYFTTGKTLALLGSSGVGKSTLVNALTGSQHMKTNAVREDDSRGRHTTTHRELIPIPGGGVLIDTPGMRELQLWADERSLDRTFDELAEHAQHCRFRDCRHENEPGCAVRAAIERGELDEARLESHRKLKRELDYLARKQDKRLQSNAKARWKQIHKELRRRGKS